MKKLLVGFGAAGLLLIATSLIFRVSAPVNGPTFVPMPFFYDLGPLVVLVIAALTATTGALGFALVRARRSAELQNRPIDSRITDARLERIEQAVEAMAVEIERIGEMERSAARILASRPLEGEPRSITPKPFPARVITPH